MSDSLEYSIEIDKKIPAVFKNILSEEVEKFVRLTHGEQNYVYKVHTKNSNIYILRVFRSQFWPEKDKPVWIEDQFRKHNIPHAKIIHHTRESDYFDFGFMITEFIDGINGEEAIKKGTISFEDFHMKLFDLLQRIHQIPLQRFGLVNNGEGEFETYKQYKLQDFYEYKSDILNIPGFDKSLLEQVESILNSHFDDVDALTPVLVHGDPTPDNSILTKDGEVVLIDWDDARAGWWFDDIAWLIYCGSHISEKGSLAERKEIFYQRSRELQNQDRNKLEIYQKLFDLTKAVGLVRYYYFSQKNTEHYQRTLNRLKEILKEF